MRVIKWKNDEKRLGLPGRRRGGGVFRPLLRPGSTASQDQKPAHGFVLRQRGVLDTGVYDRDHSDHRAELQQIKRFRGDALKITSMDVTS
jgi:hypothetical protein